MIRGGTPHFDYVCAAATDGLHRVALDTASRSASGCSPATPSSRPWTGPGSRDPSEDKGYEATSAALVTALTLRQVRRGLTPYAEQVPQGPGHQLGSVRMKTFDELWTELSDKARTRPEGSGTVAALDAGVHAIGKKLVEEAAESWMAAEHEGRERAAEEISQLLYHAQVLMLATGIDLDDVYAHL